jgi:hypothetical protein
METCRRLRELGSCNAVWRELCREHWQSKLPHFHLNCREGAPFEPELVLLVFFQTASFGLDAAQRRDAHTGPYLQYSSPLLQNRSHWLVV